MEIYQLLRNRAKGEIILKKIGLSFDQELRNDLNDNFNETDKRLTNIEQKLKELGFFD